MGEVENAPQLARQERKAAMKMMRMVAGLLIAGAWLCVVGVLLADDRKDDSKKESGDREFARKVSASGLAEVNLSNLAVTLSANPQVKQFAQRLVVDHTRANRQLIGLANGIPSPLRGEGLAERKRPAPSFLAVPRISLDSHTAHLLVPWRPAGHFPAGV
jgi:hypothetical protein